MQALRFFFSSEGRLAPQPFLIGAIAVYALGLASHLLTTPAALTRAGLWPFVAAQFVLVWLWFALHAKRLRDAGHGSGVAAAVATVYVLSVALLLFVADSFFNTSDGLMGNANAAGALDLILLLYVIDTLLGSTQYDLAWVVVALLTLMALIPVVVTVACTVWAATRPGVAFVAQTSPSTSPSTSPRTSPRTSRSKK